MQNIINQALVEFIKSRLSPPPEERDMISKRYEELQKILEGNSFQNGSYARHTSTTPVNDLDVFYVLPAQVMKALAEKRVDPEKLDITDILNSLADQLQDSYRNVATIKIQPHSVGIFFGSESEFSIDVVPAQPLPNDMFLVPESSHLSVHRRREFYKNKPALRWIKSDPKGYGTQATNLDDATSGAFRKAAKFVKKWRIGCKQANDAFPLKSFHVEIAVTELFKRQQTISCAEAIDIVLSNVSELITRPQYPDRADSTRFVDQYVATLLPSERALVMAEHARLHDHLAQLRNALTTTAVLKAIDSLLQLGETEAFHAPAVMMSRKKEEYSKPYFLE